MTEVSGLIRYAVAHEAKLRAEREVTRATEEMVNAHADATAELSKLPGGRIALLQGTELVTYALGPIGQVMVTRA